MRHLAFVALALALAACGSKKEKEAPPAPTPATGAAPTPTPTPTPPAPTPPAEPADVVYHPVCSKLVTAELMAKSHGADAITPGPETEQTANCTLAKGGQDVGIISFDCAPGADSPDMIAGFDIERQAMQQGAELSPKLGRAGYRIGDKSFVILDDDTPCRIRASWLADAPPWEETLRALMAATTPASIK